MIKVGVVSDTHGLLRPAVMERLAGVDFIIHAGDVGRPEVLTGLTRIAPTRSIRGNVDTALWACELPTTLTLDVGGRTIYVVHDIKEIGGIPSTEVYDVIIYGHTHRANFATREGVLYLNPGSAGPRRFKLPVTLATLDISAGLMRPSIHEIAV
jgi:putative phosphoesterase